MSGDAREEADDQMDPMDGTLDDEDRVIDIAQQIFIKIATQVYKQGGMYNGAGVQKVR